MDDHDTIGLTKLKEKIRFVSNDTLLSRTRQRSNDSADKDDRQ